MSKFQIFDNVTYVPSGDAGVISDIRDCGALSREYFVTFPDQPGLSGRWTTYVYLAPRAQTRRQAARTAGEALVKGERQNAYGDPDVSFNRIAKLWSAHLGTEVTKRDVALMMILMKVSREKSNHKADNLDDIEGYVYCARTLKED